MRRMRTTPFLLSSLAAAAVLFAAGCATPSSPKPAAAGPVTTPSGLVYEAIQEGTGASPAATDVVKVRYRGTFPDGREFDSSRGETVEFPLNRVIKCWTEGVQRMKPGGRAKLTCPPQIAYASGARAA